VCDRIPAGPCKDRTASAVGAIAAGRTVVAVVVRCATTCTDQAGRGTTIVTLDDGSTLQSVWEYATATAS
jgi:hypothetical protein